MKFERELPRLALALFLAEIVLILVSWIVSASMPGLGVRSLLGGEGMRWLVSRHTDLLASPLLVYLLFLAVAYGWLKKSGIHKIFRKTRPLVYRERTALKYTILTLIVYIVAMLLLTAIPHAVLLGVDGSLCSSPFIDGLVPLLALGLCTVSFVYGLLVGSLDTVSALYKACVLGLKAFAPMFLFYLLGAYFFHSLLYVLWIIQ